MTSRRVGPLPSSSCVLLLRPLYCCHKIIDPFIYGRPLSQYDVQGSFRNELTHTFQMISAVILPCVTPYCGLLAPRSLYPTSWLNIRTRVPIPSTDFETPWKLILLPSKLKKRGVIHKTLTRSHPAVNVLVPVSHIPIYQYLTFPLPLSLLYDVTYVPDFIDNEKTRLFRRLEKRYNFLSESPCEGVKQHLLEFLRPPIYLFSEGLRGTRMGSKKIAQRTRALPKKRRTKVDKLDWTSQKFDPKTKKEQPFKKDNSL